VSLTLSMTLSLLHAWGALAGHALALVHASQSGEAAVCGLKCCLPVTY
jgi:hypothetical protein